MQTLPNVSSSPESNAVGSGDDLSICNQFREI